ncbi:MAG TPA: T9SS type A sorting domain-containing protein [Ignavibacteriaceae bacterium]|nr:T9SS type A sorting domain-containing protein [Ignavibacteriaceae bacterium]
MFKFYNSFKVIFFIFIIAKLSLAQGMSSRTITVDGNPSDWIGTPGVNIHSVVISEGEWIYKGTSGDERTDYTWAQPPSNNDITEVRMGTDGTNLYFLVRMSDITDEQFPHLCFVITNGVSIMTFIGDDSDDGNFNGGPSIPLGNDIQKGRLIDVHYSSYPCAELYNGGSWYNNISVSISTTNDVIEFALNLTDLGLTSSSSTNISFITAPNRIGWNNDVDGTAWNFGFGPGAVDVMTPGSGNDNAWLRDVSDGDIDSYATINLADVPLPVELTSLTAIIKENNVELNWITETEVNSFSFEIEKQVSNVWEKIGEVKANGNSNSEKFYSFVDKVQTSDNITYRLKMIDADGSYKYSKIVEVGINNPSKFLLNQNYPNPFNPSTIISFNVPEKSNVTLKVFDMLGNEVATLINEVKDAGYYNIDFDGSRLTSGIYVYELSHGVYRSIRKMTLLK